MRKESTMSMCKRLLVLGALFIAVSSIVVAQSANRPGLSSADREMSVEQSYLQESVELMIIREQSRTDSRDMKFVALEYIGDAINRGNKSDDIRAALEYLSLEGVLNTSRENGRVINNFPDVRKQAATYLGQLGTPEARVTLLKMVEKEKEPMVITEVIRSLGIIGNNDNNEVTRTISWYVNRFHELNPDNFMALSALDAFARIAAANNGLRDRAAVDTIIKISEGPYILPIRDKAKALLEDLRNYD
jgi:HEAT repeat protein